MSKLGRRAVLAGLPASFFAGCETIDPRIIEDVVNIATQTGLTEGEAAEGIRAALIQGTDYAANLLGEVGGYLLDNAVRIPLPDDLAQIQSTLSQVGFSGLLDELQEELNRGAEAAAPQAKSIFADVITGLTVQDAINIVQGADDAATQYLRSKTTSRLINLFTPVINNALAGTGAFQTLDQLTAQMSMIPFGPQMGADAKRDLIAHGVDYGLRGLFHYIAIEEKAIRDNPAKRTTEILRKVFGY